MSTFRVEDGIAWVGDKPYRWARDTQVDHGGFGWAGFRLVTENAWVVSVTWRTVDHDPEFSPPGEIAAVDAEALGLTESVMDHDEDMGTWPHGTPWNWSLIRCYISRHERLDEIVAEAARHPSPTWPIPSEWKGGRWFERDRQ